MANENSYNQDPTKPVVFGGVVFPENFTSSSNLSYTLRLSATSLPPPAEVGSYQWTSYHTHALLSTPSSSSCHMC